MPQEQKYTALILKKTAYAEADEIITLFTRENGKLRVLAKSIKRPASKLQQALQPLFLLDCAVVGRDGLPKIIRAQALKVFKTVATDPGRVGAWFVVAEMLQKGLADDHANEPLFTDTLRFLEFIDRLELDASALQGALVAFKIAFLRHIGLAIHYPKQDADLAWFSLANGGFHGGVQLADSQPVSPEIRQKFIQLRDWDFVTPAELSPESAPIFDMVNSFVAYQLEREIKADRFL